MRFSNVVRTMSGVYFFFQLKLLVFFSIRKLSGHCVSPFYYTFYACGKIERVTSGFKVENSVHHCVFFLLLLVFLLAYSRTLPRLHMQCSIMFTITLQLNSSIHLPTVVPITDATLASDVGISLYF